MLARYPDCTKTRLAVRANKVRALKLTTNQIQYFLIHIKQEPLQARLSLRDSFIRLRLYLFEHCFSGLCCTQPKSLKSQLKSGLISRPTFNNMFHHTAFYFSFPSLADVLLSPVILHLIIIFLNNFIFEVRRAPEVQGR